MPGIVRTGWMSSRARERSLDRPIILFIDHYLPHFDQDAGSKTIWAFVRLFLSEGFSVKFIGDNFFPHQPYQGIMEEMGVEVLTGSSDGGALARVAARERWLSGLRAAEPGTHVAALFGAAAGDDESEDPLLRP